MTIVCTQSAQQAESLSDQIPGAVLPVAGVAAAHAALLAHPAETVVVLGADVDLGEALELTGWMRSQRPGVGVVLLRQTLAVPDLTAAMRAGVGEVLQADDETALAAACRRFQQVVGLPPAPGGSPRGHVTTVYAAKGGCGKTTLATNLAATLSQTGQRVCLVDLDLAFGDVAITLGLRPARTLADVLSMGEALDEDMVASLVTASGPQLDCLLAPVAPGDADRIPARSTAAVIDVLSGMYDHVVIDTPAHITEHVLAALDASHQHVLLTTPEIPALKNLRLVLDMLDLLAYRGNQRTIVLNRSDAQVGLTDADIESVVRTPVSVRVPSSRDVPISINRGEPLAVQSPKHPVSVAVRRLVSEHMGQASQPTPRRSGLLRMRRSS